MKPQLDHNRQEYDALVGYSRLAAVTGAVLTFALIIALPTSMAPAAMGSRIVLTISVLAVLAAWRVLIYRRDVRERLGDD